MLQFDLNSPIADQIKDLGSEDLEDFAAAVFHQLGYAVFQDVSIDSAGQDVGQIDIFASLQTPFHESRILVECKGGQPSFKDIFELSGISSLLDPKPDRIILACRPNTTGNRSVIGSQLSVDVIERQNFANQILPLLGDSDEHVEQARKLNPWLIALSVRRYLAEKASAYDETKTHMRFLDRELWQIGDPLEQMRRAYEAFEEPYRNTTERLGKRLDTNVLEHLRNPKSDEMESAVYTELQHRILNIYAIVRYAMHLQRGGYEMHSVVSDIGLNLRQAVAKISRNPRLIFGFPGFFQYWLFVWGGMLRAETETEEINEMASDLSVPAHTIRAYFDVIQVIYTGKSGAMMAKFDNLTIFKFVPAAFRAIGDRTRWEKGILQKGTYSMKDGEAFQAALKRATGQNTYADPLTF